jgi:3-oxoacyl-[acyl-carrier protein] reductase
MTTRLHGQTAIVTGAARGIGLGIARRLAREGCRVVSWDRDAEALASSRSEFEPALAQAVDVTDLAAVERAFAASAKTFDRIDILVNNAGVNGPTVPTWEYPPAARAVR